MNFQVVSDYKPTGDQPQAIQKLAQGVEDGDKYQTLLGVTGSGKTFTVANVIQEVQRPTLVSHIIKRSRRNCMPSSSNSSRTMPWSISYYDYYQPEAFMPVTGVFIEKDLSINDELEKDANEHHGGALLSGRRDVLVVASVSCLYGIGNPNEFQKNIIPVNKGQVISRTKLLHQLVQSLYSRTEADFVPVVSGSKAIRWKSIRVMPTTVSASIFWR
jgi:excinuclease ABC subunit B